MVHLSVLVEDRVFSQLAFGMLDDVDVFLFVVCSVCCGCVSQVK